MLKMFFLKGDHNPMIRVTGSSIVTRQVLEDVRRECLARFETAPARFKPFWSRLANDAEGLLTFWKVPVPGKAVIGPFIGRDVSFAKPGEIVKMSAGIEVHSTMPRLAGKVHHERLSREVRVAEVSAGYANLPQGEVVDPMIHWRLSNGFMAWTSVKNISERGISFDQVPTLRSVVQ